MVHSPHFAAVPTIWAKKQNKAKTVRQRTAKQKASFYHENDKNIKDVK